MTDAVPGAGERDIEPEMPDRSFGQKSLSIYVAIALMGCLILLVVFVNVPGIRAAAGTTLTMNDWQLQSYADPTGMMVPALSSPAVTIRFFRDGTVTGFSGCNQYSARYTTKDYGITIAPPVQTLMSCADTGVMTQERAYLADISNSTEFRVTESSLKMYGNTGLPLLVYVPG